MHRGSPVPTRRTPPPCLFMQSHHSDPAALLLTLHLLIPPCFLTVPSAVGSEAEGGARTLPLLYTDIITPLLSAENDLAVAIRAICGTAAFVALAKRARHSSSSCGASEG
ncbi:hypothetical protein E2C01_074134 [Portunus trituberculatus]|uniref:Uncharacterized protein n=1 Tax=Portunus trituberculatus TaxID=210409 RepID=A0A5B7IFI6_PORTR|nr:hypothetical protein [Portunus trituberculatus]